jgi:hypothetical protein
VRRLLALVTLACAAVAATAGSAPAATNECRGLMICVPVAGPWVAVPTSTRVPRPKVEWQLSCPRGYIVGGLDAELTDRAIDVAFLGQLGSPVNPGVTTQRAVVVVASYVGGSARTPSFRPHIGCIPAAGGGGRIPTVASQVYPPGVPTMRRVKATRLAPVQSARISQPCAADERLVDASHAVGYYRKQPPTAALVGAVRTAQSIPGNRVVVNATAGAAIRGVRTVVQVSAVCAVGGQ